MEFEMYHNKSQTIVNLIKQKAIFYDKELYNQCLFFQIWIKYQIPVITPLP